MDRQIPMHLIYQILSKHDLQITDKYGQKQSLNWFCRELSRMKEEEENFVKQRR